ncbi:thiazolylpeptide-type bacteriocin [Arthrobacter terricola]
MIDICLPSRTVGFGSTQGGTLENTQGMTITLPDLDFDGIEVLSVRESVAVPETGATSGSSSSNSSSCCGSSSCCSS